jgi:hypothetical protein
MVDNDHPMKTSPDSDAKASDQVPPPINLPETSVTPGPIMLPPGMSFPGGLEAMMQFVEQQLGTAEKQFNEMTKPKPDLDVLAADGLERPSDSMLVGPFANAPNVYGNTQTGYRADLRFGADVRPVMNCHQCKTNKKIEELVFCGHVSIDAKGYSTTCTKRYCRTCLWNWYMEQAPKNDPDSEPMWNIWRCPSCRKLCCCHRCRTFGKIQRGLDMTDLQEQAGALSPARCLARALQEAPDAMHVAGDVKSKKCKPCKPARKVPALVDTMEVDNDSICDAPLLSEDDTTDTEHLRNELAGDELTADNAQSEQVSKE